MTQDPHPFYVLKEAETALDNARITGNEEQDYQQLLGLLRKERELDQLRLEMFEAHAHGSDEANDYLFREYMARHRVTEFASKLDKKIVSRIAGELPEEKSVVAMHIRNGKIYPKPELKNQS